MTFPAALKPKIGAKAENQEVSNPPLKLGTSSTFVPAEVGTGISTTPVARDERRMYQNHFLSFPWKGGVYPHPQPTLAPK